MPILQKNHIRGDGDWEHTNTSGAAFAERFSLLAFRNQLLFRRQPKPHPPGPRSVFFQALRTPSASSGGVLVDSLFVQKRTVFLVRLQNMIAQPLL